MKDRRERTETAPVRYVTGVALRRFRITLAYDGGAFYGFQKQPGVRTVQGVLEQALGRLSGSPVTLVGAGRTDTGVHALGQVAHFESRWGGPTDRLKPALNSLAPSDIAVLSAEQAPEGFHARYSARFRRYGYFLFLSERRNPLLERFALRVSPEMDWAAADRVLNGFRGSHDFGAFSSDLTEEQRRNTVRTVQCVRCVRTGRMSVILVQADGFLRHMVRFMVSAVLRAGMGSLETAQTEEMLAGGARLENLSPAPPEALCLLRVGYRAVN